MSLQVHGYKFIRHAPPPTQLGNRSRSKCALSVHSFRNPEGAKSSKPKFLTPVLPIRWSVPFALERINQICRKKSWSNFCQNVGNNLTSYFYGKDKNLGMGRGCLINFHGSGMNTLSRWDCWGSYDSKTLCLVSYWWECCLMPYLRQGWWQFLGPWVKRW